MSSTSNAQDLLVNVFRPTYRWDSNTGFVPSLVVSNVSEIITGSLKTDALVVSDSGNNTYIGSNAGLRAINTSYNVGLGYQAMGGAINSSNNVAVGYYALDGVNNSTSNVVLGAYSGIVSSNGGTRNVLVGPNVTLASGTGNILIGTDISLASVSNRLQLGKLIYGDLQSGFIGVNLTDPSGAFDVSGTTFFRGKVGIQTTEESPKYSLDVNGSIYANNRFFGGLGSFLEPLYSFDAASNTGMYVPAAIAGYGNGAFAIAVNQKPAAIFSDTCVNFFQNLDVSGTFSACNVQISAFAVEPGTRTDPTITFASNRSDGFYHLPGADGFSAVTLGQDRMMFLGSGDISSARILGSDISLSGAIFTNSGCNVVGGVTLSNGNVILTGTATNSNLLVPGWIRDNETAPVVDISDGTVQAIKFRAQNGSAPSPAYSFSSDPSSGMHLVRTSAIGFDTAGIQRMCISGGFVGIGTSAPRVALDVSGDISANVYNGPGGTALAPHYTFSDDRTTGFFFPGANIIGMTAGGRERMRISNGFVAIGTTVDPSSTLDVSGVFRIIGANGNITFNNGTIDVSGTPLVSTTGAFSNATTTSNVIGGVTLSNRDLSMTDTGRILGMLGVSNVIGGTTFSNFDISLASGGRILGMPNTSNRIGGVTLDSTNITYAGRISNTLDTTSNRIGGVTLDTTNIIYAGRISNTLDTTSNRIGGVTLNAGSITYATTITGTTDNTTNKIGGVTLSNGSITAGNPALINTIGSVYISNYTITTADATGLNSIGGVTLSSSNITYGGRISNTVDNTSNRIGGVILDSTNITNSGLTQSSNFRGSNGSATIPTYSFTNDPSTGLHLAGGSQLAFDTAGVQRMVLSNSVLALGRTPVADVSLIFQTPSNAYISTGRIYLGDAPNSTPAYGATIIEGLSNGGSGACDLLFYSRAAGFGAGSDPVERMRILGSNGRVGIGTKDPGATLDLSGGVVRVQRVYNGLANALVIADSTATGIPIARWGVGILNTATGSGSGGNDFSIQAYNDAGGFTSPFVIKRSNGNVGIGATADPTATLDIRSETPLLRVSDTTVNRNPIIELNRNAGQPFGSSTIVDWRMQVTPQGGNLQFLRGNNTSTLTAIHVDGLNGLVGIGTTTPAALLDISASGNAFRVGNGNTSGGPFFQVSNTLNAYANVTMNGYFTLLQANTSNGKPYISFSPEYRIAGHWILGNDLGIGTSNPSQVLDVSGIIRSFNDGQDVMGLFDPRHGNYLRIGAWNRAGNTSKAIRLNIDGGNVGIGPNTPAHLLDVNGTIRGSSNIVAVTTSKWSVGSFTGYTDTTLSISYTPKQSGTVTLLIIAGAEMRCGEGSGTDGVYAAIESGGTAISQYAQQFVNNPVDGRGNNFFMGGNHATTAISTTTTIGLHLTRGGDDGPSYRNAYLTILELSTT